MAFRVVKVRHPITGQFQGWEIFDGKKWLFTDVIEEGEGVIRLGRFPIVVDNETYKKIPWVREDVYTSLGDDED